MEFRLFPRDPEQVKSKLGKNVHSKSTATALSENQQIATALVVEKRNTEKENHSARSHGGIPATATTIHCLIQDSLVSGKVDHVETLKTHSCKPTTIHNLHE